MHEELLSILVCPVCKVFLEKRPEGFFCSECNRLYPLKEGIPVMFVEEAEIVSPEKEIPGSEKQSS